MRFKTRHRLLKEAKGVAYVLPALFFLALFTLYPMIDAVRTSLYNWNLTGRKKYIGFYNYKKLFRRFGKSSAIRCSTLYLCYQQR